MASSVDSGKQTPLDTSLSPLPPADDLTPSQWSAFLAICDTIVPSVDLTSVTSVPNEAERNFYAEKPSELPEFRPLIRRMLFQGLPKSESDALRRVLDAFSYSAGSLLLTGQITFIADQPLKVREQILDSWGRSRFGALRLLQRQLTFLTKQAWARTSLTLYPLVGIPRVPVDCRVGQGFDFKFIQLPPGDEPEVLETDVIIVGSGCGGGVAARVLSESGLRVIVVDKGHYWPPQYLPMTENHGPFQMFMNGVSDDGSVVILAGQTWGGGGTINWSASLPLPGYVRREWSSKGLPLFTSSSFQDSIDRVSEVMSVSTKNLNHSKPNQALMRGSKRIGWAHSEVAQNTGGEDHFCGHCSLGCRSGGKKGPSETWLPKAAAAGAKFIEGFDVTRVLFDKSKGEKTATGIEGLWRGRDTQAGTSSENSTTRKVIIKARKVIISGGTLQSPLLLLRSGLVNKHIGRNLYLHPVSLLGAVYDEEMRPWEGPIISSVCTEFENLDGQGHGVKLETTSMMPWSWIPWLPWRSGTQLKQLASKMRNTAAFISVSKDKNTGRVYPDPVDGRFRVQYHPSKLDQSHILEGVIALARINYEAGARVIFTTLPTLDNFVRKDGEDEANSEAQFQGWLRKLRSHGFPEPETPFVAAHQMGTCRMSASPKSGVVDERGRVWGTRGLHVIDASVFPTASGVNPFLTVMAIADNLSRSIADGWTKERL